MFLTAGVALVGANGWVLWSTKSFIVPELSEASPAPVAIVLGTGKLFGGKPNVHFTNRIEMAAALFHAGKVSHLLLSGDNSRADYNEPADMQAALLAKGVPASAMTLDFAGFRTFDSMVRARDIFAVGKCIVVTDDFHLPRAVFLARHYGLEATGVACAPVTWGRSVKSRSREWLARVKVLLDVWILRTEPKFGGEPEPLPAS